MNDLREVDLERGMPRAEQAIRQMLFELRSEEHTSELQSHV